MNKAGWVLGAVIIIAALTYAAYFLIHTYQPAPLPPEQQSGTGNASVGATGTSAVVTYTDAGFSPSQLSIAVGTTVTWVNQSSHPLLIEGVGSSNQPIGAGGSYSYTFTNLGTISYRNHDRSNDTGSIRVAKVLPE